MPEGPSLVILREHASVFQGRRILRVEGDSKLDFDRLRGRTVTDIRTWGKHFLVQVPGVALRIHLLMFGSWCIDQRKDKPLRIGLGFAQGRELNFYSCAARYIDEPLDQVYDWRGDVMSEAFDPALARRRLRALPEQLACDALLNQEILAGVGNIIKNEVLFRIRLHPLSPIGALPAPKLRELVDQARQYSFEFYEWKKAGVLRAHWLAHTKSICPRCNIPFHKGHLGLTQRRSFWCERCQVRYG
ncbi:DNA-formamidopyrimidine glycosylase family protein [Ramlibacter tataouinensis]|uniref:DNA-formamidopyrimidine glycosylase-like protein n=1 Tax=Ramlibacter tataouinensis (strain ATCC BAA-407 / DSM 14655 / LMG 21543 / TTB310) TaxID=365046 RepID=F5Y0A7_RAMTT|nr:DNA-formamidopyrimidine glycosylase family protein [Ramlibacter tataouinensis]AEG92129.1 DNA-formamidopyrimidine glycosylase-like protein [Ramlibacter tataouinensis TTB310]